LVLNLQLSLVLNVRPQIELNDLRASTFEVTLSQPMVRIRDKFFIATIGNELKMHVN
jgi:hypothetical protein